MFGVDHDVYNGQRCYQKDRARTQVAVHIAATYLLTIAKCEKDAVCDIARFSVDTVFTGDGQRRLLQYSTLEGWLQFDTAMSEPAGSSDVLRVTANASQLTPRPLEPYRATINVQWRNFEPGANNRRGNQTVEVHLTVIESKFLDVNQSKCARGAEKYPECRVCAQEHHNLGGDECFKCSKGLECLGGARIYARSGFWQGPPYLKDWIFTGVQGPPDERRRQKKRPKTTKDSIFGPPGVATGVATGWMRSHTEPPSSAVVLEASGFKARVYRCRAGEEACPGKEQIDGVWTANQCAEGYKGVACAFCIENYSYTLGTGKCFECPESKVRDLTLALVAVFFGVLFILYYFAAKPLLHKHHDHIKAWFFATRVAPMLSRGNLIFKTLDHMYVHTAALREFFKVFVGFIQVITGLALPQFSWPVEFTAITDTLNVFQFNLEFTSVGCVAGEEWTRYFNRLLFNTLAPVIMLILLYLPTVYAKYFASAEKFLHIRTLFWQSFYLLTFLIYPTVSKTVIAYFKCDELWVVDEGPEGWRQQLYLHMDYRIHCDSSEYEGACTRACTHTYTHACACMQV